MCLSLVLIGSFGAACGENVADTKLPEIFITHSGALVTKESGETVTFAMALSATPQREVIINILSSNLKEGAVEPAMVVLDESNWFVPTPLTVTGLEDGFVDGDIEYKIKLVEETDGLSVEQLKAVELDVKNLDIDQNVIMILRLLHLRLVRRMF